MTQVQQDLLPERAAMLKILREHGSVPGGLVRQACAWAVEEIDVQARAYRELAQENERLRARLELMVYRSDGTPEQIDIGDCDGIACRDETIKTLDGSVMRLRAEVERLRGEFAKLSTWLTQRQIELDESNRQRDRLRADVERLKARLEAFANANSSLAAHDTETSVMNARLRTRNAQLLEALRFYAAKESWAGTTNDAHDDRGALAQEAIDAAQQHDPEYQPIDAERPEKP